MGISFAHFNRRENLRLLATSDRKEIVHLNRAIVQGSGKNDCRNSRESRDFGALRYMRGASRTSSSNASAEERFHMRYCQGPKWSKSEIISDFTSQKPNINK